MQAINRCPSGVIYNSVNLALQIYGEKMNLQNIFAEK